MTYRYTARLVLLCVSVVNMSLFLSVLPSKQWSWVRNPVIYQEDGKEERVGSGAHPASYPMGARCSFLGGKAAGA
jgi:hypothetical protein